MKLLYINACPRGKGVSRTLRLADAFFAGLCGRAEVTEHDLSAMRLPPVDGSLLSERESLIDARAWENALFAPARDFASADAVVVAAPYWDLMFPSMLKVYIEHVFIREMTFRYEDDQPIGLCRAARAIYLTTAGSPIAGLDFGTSYLRAVFQMLGIPRFDSVTAEGLDIAGAQTEKILHLAQARAERLGTHMAMESNAGRYP